MKNIYCYVAKDGYAARVADTRSYDAVRCVARSIRVVLEWHSYSSYPSYSKYRAVHSKDILSRWTFPLVPDDNHPGGHSYEHLRGNKYIAKDNSVSLSR